MIERLHAERRRHDGVQDVVADDPAVGVGRPGRQRLRVELRRNLRGIGLHRRRALWVAEQVVEVLGLLERVLGVREQLGPVIARVGRDRRARLREQLGAESVVAGFDRVVRLGGRELERALDVSCEHHAPSGDARVGQAYLGRDARVDTDAGECRERFVGLDLVGGEQRDVGRHSDGRTRLDTREQAAAHLEEAVGLDHVRVVHVFPRDAADVRELGMALLQDLFAQAQVLVERDGVLAVEEALVRGRQQVPVVGLDTREAGVVPDHLRADRTNRDEVLLMQQIRHASSLVPARVDVAAQAARRCSARLVPL